MLPMETALNFYRWVLRPVSFPFGYRKAFKRAGHVIGDEIEIKAEISEGSKEATLRLPAVQRNVLCMTPSY